MVDLAWLLIFLIVRGAGMEGLASTNLLVTYFEGQPPVVDKNTKIQTFTVMVTFAPWPFPEDFKVRFAEVFYQQIFQVMLAAQLPIGRLVFQTPESLMATSALLKQMGNDARTGWFTVAYREPGREFGVTLSETVFQIRCDNIRLEDLVFLADRVFSKITQILTSEQLAQFTMLEKRAASVAYTFVNSYKLGDDKVQKKPTPNYKIMSSALALDRKIPTSDERNPQHALQTIGIERYIRVDFAQHALKTLRGHIYNIILSLEAPFNEKNSVLNLTSVIKMEEDFGFDLKAGLNIEVALVDFYRDIIIRRFLDNLLCTVDYGNS